MFLASLPGTRKLFKTASLDYSSSPEFDLFFDLEDQCEEEVAEAMREPTMEELLTKTREDYGSGIARPKIDEKARNEPAGSTVTWETLKMKFLTKYYMEEEILFYKGLDVPTRQILDFKCVIPSMKAADTKKAIQDMAEHSQKWHNGTSTRTRSIDTSDGLAAIQAQLNNLGREIKKVNEKVYAAQVGCESCGGPHYTKDYPLKEEGKTLEEAYYTQFGVPFPQGGRYRAAASGLYQRDNGNPSYQERRQTMEESLILKNNSFMGLRWESDSFVMGCRGRGDESRMVNSERVLAGVFDLGIQGNGVSV
ncbi:hypothetical protein Tco_0706973 [Tanacetum coccineum]|uniref:Uncharacterized protein n=1 Tax=Tanacetum coccineum TaxID=301880 RepID=A0ABQ4Y9T4_9ASTR